MLVLIWYCSLGCSLSVRQWVERPEVSRSWSPSVQQCLPSPRYRAGTDGTNRVSQQALHLKQSNSTDLKPQPQNGSRDVRRFQLNDFVIETFSTLVFIITGHRRKHAIIRPISDKRTSSWGGGGSWQGRVWCWYNQHYNNLRQTGGNGWWVVRGPPCIVIMMVDDTHPPLPPTTQQLELNLSFIANDSFEELSLSQECLGNCSEQVEDEAPYYYQ